MRAPSAWHHDPYDTVVSCTQFLVPALAVAMLVRIVDRTGQRIPPAGDLLRAGRVLVGLVGATVAVDWIAVALRTDRAPWNATGRALIVALAVLTVGTALVAGTVRHASRVAGADDGAAQAPDWTDGVLASLADLLARFGRPGRAAAGAVGWLRRVAVGGRHGLRRHRLATAALVCGTFAAGLTLAEALGDGLGAQPAAAAATRTAVGTACLLTAVLPLGGYLRVLHLRPTRTPAPPATPRPPGRAGRRPALVCAGYAMLAGVPVAVGLRAGIGALFDYPVTGWGRLVRLIIVVALLFGSLTALTQAIRRRRHRISQALLGLPLVVLLALAGTVTYLGVRHVLPRTLPAPTGPYQVGRTAYDWTDGHRIDPLAPDPGQHRELSVWVWYPAPAGTTGAPAPYAPGHWAGMLQFGILANRLDAVRTHSIEGAPVSAGRFPLVLLEPGMGLGAPQFSTLAENLASHGYVVAGVTPTYSANRTVLHGHAVDATTRGNPRNFSQAAGDRLVPVWAADARFVARRMAAVGGPLSGHVDATHVAYLGHSFGGAASLQACHDDPRCAGAADLDGTPHGQVVTTGLTAPMMLLGTPGDCLAGTCHPADAAHREILAASTSLRAASSGPSFRYEIAGAEHFNFTDYGAYYIPRALHGLTQLGPIDGDRALVVVSAYVTAFVTAVLRGGPPPEPDRRYPEVHAVT
ncbi:hypothetical protein Athai_14420 [Actinocatenispora thailandica]|uniref:Alpha/beta hydrolase n=1 Tax=Actinocatenispora thailandica TaxID=227318 RepID=A0A7R7DLH0_9ACTN|nr:hypothetical protein Athai_14420 [Actinocatenispora thailandica]